MKKDKAQPSKMPRLKDRRIIADKKFRAHITTGVSLAINVGYAFLNGGMAIASRSIWFGALAGYYILLIVLRASVLCGNAKKIALDDTVLAQKRLVRNLKIYRIAGIVLLMIIIALSFAVAQMVASNKAFKHDGIMTYANALYTTIKVIIAIINFVKAKKGDDIAIEALRNINMADAGVSLLALQSSLLRTFSITQNNSIANAATGAAVCLFILGLGIYMIIKATKMIKKAKVKYE